jgi:spore germination protein GerM
VSRRTAITMLVVIAVLAVGIFYLRSLARRIFVENRPKGEQEAHAQLSAAALQSPTGSSQTVALYFPSYTKGTLVGEARQIAWASNDTDRIRQVILGLIEGSRKGASRVIAPASNIRAVFLVPDGTAFIDLSSEALTDFESGIESESLAIYSIVNSVAANVPTVKKVKILIQGQEVDTLDGHADLTGFFVPDASRISGSP